MCSVEKIFSSAINKHVLFAHCIRFFSYWQMTEGCVRRRAGHGKIDVAGKSSKICAAMRIYGRRIEAFVQINENAGRDRLWMSTSLGTYRRMPVADIVSRPWY